MATLNITVQHTLSETEALKRIKKLLRETKEEYGDMVTNLKERWKGNEGTFSFEIKGYVLTGTIVVMPKKVVMEGELPWTLRFIKGKIEKLVRARAHERLR